MGRANKRDLNAILMRERATSGRGSDRQYRSDRQLDPYWREYRSCPRYCSSRRMLLLVDSARLFIVTSPPPHTHSLPSTPSFFVLIFSAAAEPVYIYICKFSGPSATRDLYHHFLPSFNLFLLLLLLLLLVFLKSSFIFFAIRHSFARRFNLLGNRIEHDRVLHILFTVSCRVQSIFKRVDRFHHQGKSQSRYSVYRCCTSSSCSAVINSNYSATCSSRLILS